MKELRPAILGMLIALDVVVGTFGAWVLTGGVLPPGWGAGVWFAATIGAFLGWIAGRMIEEL